MQYGQLHEESIDHGVCDGDLESDHCSNVTFMALRANFQFVWGETWESSIIKRFGRKLAGRIELMDKVEKAEMIEWFEEKNS